MLIDWYRATILISNTSLGICYLLAFCSNGPGRSSHFRQTNNTTLVCHLHALNRYRVGEIAVRAALTSDKLRICYGLPSHGRYANDPDWVWGFALFGTLPTGTNCTDKFLRLSILRDFSVARANISFVTPNGQHMP